MILYHLYSPVNVLSRLFYWDFMASKKKKSVRERDYKKEYLTYHGKPEQITNRAKRNKARREMEKRYGKAALKGKEVDHKNPLSKGGSNARSNLQVISRTANRKKGNKI